MKNDDRLGVVHVTFGLDVGGLEKLLVQIAKHTDRDRYHLTVVSLGHIGPIGEDLRRLDVPVVCMHRSEGFHPSLVGQLKRCFQKVSADVVHTHDARPLIYAAPAARWAGVNAIVHTQHGRSFGDSGRQKWLIRQSAKRVDHFVAVSKDIAEMAVAHGVDEKKVSVILNGIGNEWATDDDDALGDDMAVAGSPAKPIQSLAQRKTVLCVARLSPEKGVSTLVDAAAEVLRRNSEVQFVIAGDGVCRADLDKQVDRLGLKDRVRLIGQSDRVTELFGEARVFVLPSNSEGISLTLLEAMFARVPIVATEVGGTPEVIRHNENGLLVPPRDPIAMADAIEKLWGDARLGRDMADSGYRIANKRFSVATMLREYQQLYGDSQNVDAQRKQNAQREQTAKVEAATV